MTARSGVPAGQAAKAPLPLVIAGAVAGAAAGVVSFLLLALICLAAWMLEPSGQQEWAEMVEVAAAAWLAGLGLAPTISGITLTLLPFGFVVIPIIGLVAAARWAVGSSAVARRGEALAVAAAAALAFGAFAAVLAGMSPSIGISPVRAALSGAVLAGLVTALTAVRRAGLIGADALPGQLRDALVAAVVALLVLVACAGLALAVTIVAHVDDITALLVLLNGGASGLVMLAALSLAYIPTALVWSVAYLLGPGVSVGSNATVSPFTDTVSTTLPGFPLLAALPSQAPTGSVLLPLAGVLAGVLAGFLLRRRGVRGRAALSLGGVAALIVGAVLAVASWLASGALGVISLVGVGPPIALVALAGIVTVGIGTSIAAAWPSKSSHE